MATYSAVTSGQIDSESPLDVTLAGQWTNNLLAVIEGDASAPKIASAALADYPFAAGSDVTGVAWVLLDSWTPTAVNSKDFTWSESLYSSIMVVIEAVSPATDGASLYAYVGYNNGGTFFSGTADYQLARDTYTNTTYTAISGVSSTEIDLSSGGVGSGTGEGLAAVLNLEGAAGATQNGCPVIHAHTSFRTAANDEKVTRFWGQLWEAVAATTAMDSIRLQWSSGNFDPNGKVYVYGLSRT